METSIVNNELDNNDSSGLGLISHEKISSENLSLDSLSVMTSRLSDLNSFLMSDTEGFPKGVIDELLECQSSLIENISICVSVLSS